MEGLDQEHSRFDYVEVTEQKRLNEAREKSVPWQKVGALSQREAMGHGSGRLQPRRECVGLLFA